MKHRQSAVDGIGKLETTAGNGAYDMMDGKKLCKSSVNRKIAGVCGGLAEYFNIGSVDLGIVCVLWWMRTSRIHHCGNHYAGLIRKIAKHKRSAFAGRFFLYKW